MSDKHSKKTLLPRKSGNNKTQQIIVFVEGRNTERTYIEQLKHSNLKMYPIVCKGKGIGSCLDFVNDSKKAYDSFSKDRKKKYAQKWLMFDYDGHDDFRDAILLARENGFHVAFSSMCIEYWFMLHFQDHKGESIPLTGNSHSNALIDIINKHISKHNNSYKDEKLKVKLYDSGSKTIDDDFFNLMMSIDPCTKQRRIESACQRASNNYEKKKKDGAEFKESVTTVFCFLEAIGFVTKDKDGHYHAVI